MSEQQLPPGLIIIPDVISEWVEDLLLRKVDKEKWDSWLKRRTQQYGYEYHYDTRRQGSEVPMPVFMRRVRLHIERTIRKNTGLEIPGTAHVADDETDDWTGKISSYFDQSILNEYMPGQGIGKHTDQPNLFTDVIAILCLGSDITMVFEKGSEEMPVRMPKRSLVLMTGAARYSWTHRIDHVKSDKVNGIAVPRKRRVSMTFRRRKAVKN